MTTLCHLYHSLRSDAFTSSLTTRPAANQVARTDLFLALEPPLRRAAVSKSML